MNCSVRRRSKTNYNTTNNISEVRDEILRSALREWSLKILKLRLEPEIIACSLNKDLLEYFFQVNEVLKEFDNPEVRWYVTQRNKDLCEAAISNYIDHLEAIKRMAEPVLRKNPLHRLSEEIRIANAILDGIAKR